MTCGSIGELDMCVAVFVGGPWCGQRTALPRRYRALRVPYAFASTTDTEEQTARYAWYSRVMTAGGCDFEDEDGVGRFMFCGFDEPVLT